MAAVMVVVLDMDETLGVSVGEVFHVRPHVDFLVQMLRCMRVDVVLWSLGVDEYVQRVVNQYLPLIKRHAYKIFGRTQAKSACQEYGYWKAGSHIRDLYEEDIFLIGVDDCANKNMDAAAYDVTMQVQPYKKPDPSDTVIWQVCEQIVESISPFQK